MFIRIFISYNVYLFLSRRLSSFLDVCARLGAGYLGLSQIESVGFSSLPLDFNCDFLLFFCLLSVSELVEDELDDDDSDSL